MKVYILYYQPSKGEYARIEASRCRTATPIDGIFNPHLTTIKNSYTHFSVSSHPKKDFKNLLSNAGQRSRIVFSNDWYFLTTKFDEFSS